MTTTPRRYTVPLALLSSLLLLIAPLSVRFASDPGTAGLDMYVPLLIVTMLPLITPSLLRLLGYPCDIPLLSPAWILCALGLTVIARVQPSLVNTQALWVVAGWTFFIGLAGLPQLLTCLRRYRRIWVGLALIVFIAGYLTERGHLLSGDQRGREGAAVSPARYWLPLFAIFGLSMLAVVAQRDFGPALLFAAAFLGMLYVATGRRDAIAATGAGLVLAAVAGYAL